MNKEKDLEHLKLPSPTITKCVYHMENGEVLDDAAFLVLVNNCKADYRRPPVVCAKQITNTDTKIITYFVLCANSQIFDPKNKDSRYRIRNRWKLTRVVRSTYELYIKFLNTNHKIFLHQAERGV